jgi:hypothetical protein
MRKAILALGLAALVMQVYSLRGQTPKTNFRQATWGMTLADIVKLEGQEPKAKSKSTGGLDMFSYLGKLGNLDCTYVYFFAEGKLVGGRYVFLARHSREDEYVSDYELVKASLIEKYGQPKEDEPDLRNNRYRNELSKWGLADLKYEATWTLGDTEIILELTRKSIGVGHSTQGIHHSLQYWSTLPEHVALMKKIEEATKKGTR